MLLGRHLLWARVFPALALFLALPLGAGAQEVRGTVTLEEAIRLARYNSPAFLRTANSEVVADWGVREAYGEFLPRLSSGFSGQYSAPGTPSFGIFDAGDLGFGVTDYYFSSYALRASYSLQGSSLFRVASARADRKATLARIQAAEYTLESEVTAQYLMALRAGDEVEVSRRLLTRAEEGFELADARVEVGAAIPTDAKQAEVERGRARVALIEAESQLRNQKLLLLELMGVQAPEDFQLPYLEKEVVYQNEGVTLAGTLTVPEGPGPFPAVVVITGSGAQDRDETIFGHRPFAVIADHLTRGGIAVLRVDDRGVRGSSGSLAMATLEGLAGDALAGIRTLESRPEILNRRIGLVGHSQGAKVAAIAAAQDSAVAFLVLMAGSGLPLAETAVIQARVIGEARGAEEEFLDRQEEAQRELYRLLAADADSEARRSQLKKLITVQVRAIDSSQGQDDDLIEGLVDGHLRQLTSAFSRSNSWFDPRSALREVRVPVLALTGTLDLQVPPEVHLPEIEEALREGGNRGVTIHRLPGLNHLFQRAGIQESVGGGPSGLPPFVRRLSSVRIPRRAVNFLEEVPLLFRTIPCSDGSYSLCTGRIEIRVSPPGGTLR